MCYFDVSQEKMLHVIKEAAKLGFELVVLDDGWFGHRNNSKSSLGDWTVNTEKFPDGLTPLLKCAKENGIQLGIWFEPEMISPDSALMKSHSSWHMQIDGYTPLLGRNQLVLDFTQLEIQDYIINTMSNFLEEYPVSYIKWDMNRHMTDPGAVIIRTHWTASLYNTAHPISFRPLLSQPMYLLSQTTRQDAAFLFTLVPPLRLPRIWAMN